MRKTRRRRLVAALILLVVAILLMIVNPDNYRTSSDASDVSVTVPDSIVALDVLEALPVKGRAPANEYRRSHFGDGWESIGGCTMRNLVLKRDMTNVVIGNNCAVQTAELIDPYTGKIINFVRGATTSDDVQIDHVVALSDAWQKGAQQLTQIERIALANDPLELLAVDGEANQAKGNGDAATWLPSNKAFRCQYVARQIAVKSKYRLWVTGAEKDAIKRVLSACPGQTIPHNSLPMPVKTIV